MRTDEELIDEKMVDYIRRTAGGRGREWALQCCRIGAWRAREKFGDAATRGHAFNFARSTARDDQAGERRVYRRFALADDVHGDERRWTEEAPAPEFATPEERVDAARAYAVMPVWFQTVLRLYAQGLSSREIAAGMQVPDRTVRSWLVRAQATVPAAPGARTRARSPGRQ